MSSCKLPNVPSLRRQQLHLEFASIRKTPPPGVYVTLSPTDPSLWSGVLFVRKGPYASAILRFQIRFPPTYPDLPPLVTFTTEIFHPLIVPLTTYTFTTGSSDADTVSATDEGRLPPGGFSLRHGFPHWFGRSKRNATTSRSSSSRNVSGNSATSDGSSATKSVTGGGSEGHATTATTSTTTTESEMSSVGRDGSSKSTLPTINSPVRISPVPSSTTLPRPQIGRDVPIVKLLNYIRSTFDEESVLDSVPLEAAGNSGAWHAWRSHRKGPEQGASPAGPLSPDAKAKRVSPQARPPGEWNWEGVWAKRTQNGIKNSYLESVLFGTSGRGGGTDDPIRFSKLDAELLERLKEDLLATANKNDT